MKKCPYCGSELSDEVRKCRFCGEWVSPNNYQPATQPPRVQIVNPNPQATPNNYQPVTQPNPVQIVNPYPQTTPNQVNVILPKEESSTFAVITMIMYLFFYVPGLILTIIGLITGPKRGCFLSMFILFVLLPAAIIIIAGFMGYDLLEQILDYISNIGNIF